MTEFTPLLSLIGGMLVGTSAAVMLAYNGRIAGISGILGGLLAPDDRDWRALFVVGLLLGGFALRVFYPDAMPGSSGSLALMIGAGLLVGFGTRMGGGCTSGHGVCGMARLSTRSLVATPVFMLAAATTVYLVRHGFLAGVVQ